MAGAVNSVILRRLQMIELAAGVVLVGGTFYTAFRYKQWLNWVVLVLAAAMLTTAVYYTAILFPKVDALRVSIGNFDSVPAEKAELHAEFDRGHVQYSALVKGVLACGVLVLVLHTVAFVRYTELHADRYRELEGKWLAHKEREKRGEPPAIEKESGENGTRAPDREPAR
jgi:hypothetical protein